MTIRVMLDDNDTLILFTGMDVVSGRGKYITLPMGAVKECYDIQSGLLALGEVLKRAKKQFFESEKRENEERVKGGC